MRKLDQAWVSKVGHGNIEHQGCTAYYDEDDRKIALVYRGSTTLREGRLYNIGGEISQRDGSGTLRPHQHKYHDYTCRHPEAAWAHVAEFGVEELSRLEGFDGFYRVAVFER